MKAIIKCTKLFFTDLTFVLRNGLFKQVRCAN